MSTLAATLSKKYKCKQKYKIRSTDSRRFLHLPHYLTLVQSNHAILYYTIHCHQGFSDLKMFYRGDKYSPSKISNTLSCPSKMLHLSSQQALLFTFDQYHTMCIQCTLYTVHTVHCTTALFSSSLYFTSLAIFILYCHSCALCVGQC